ncbi:MAG TPA: endonuclease/exonuclease/phosphatase family protein [Polyangiaceae bacterium]|nr:endonuclease/exonuclease/phosphatase family protein [Polyangiaceae bacterium]
MSVLRVATINVWNKSGPWLSRLGLIRRELERLQPEIVGLQEVLRFRPDHAREAPLTVHNDQLTEIADGLGYQLAYGIASDYGNGLKFGNALMSRHPIVAEQNFPLPGSESGETRALLYALCQTPHGALPVFVTHLNWKFHQGSIRQRQVVFIADRVAELSPVGGPQLPPVLLGDFNAAPDADEIRFLTGLCALEQKTVYFADAWVFAGEGPGHTFDRANHYAAKAREPSRRIDYIFVRGPDRQFRGEPLRAELAFNAVELGGAEPVWPSDHFGVVADLAITERRF